MALANPDNSAYAPAAIDEPISAGDCRLRALECLDSAIAYLSAGARKGSLDETSDFLTVAQNVAACRRKLGT